MIRNNKGDISITTIVVAALALIVLVVLAMVFTGRIGVFNKGVNEQGNAELSLMRVSYGSCQPAVAAETAFVNALNAAESEEAKEEAKSEFRSEISNCKTYSDKESCEQNGGCLWP